ncbi:hypothetical protein D9613_003113 [Agrocybe pediades]|uniref:Carbohydrate esterase family 16 protein n=1 Tax=Agrocybe pediades TaxID=84607 RepID=A0A8H4QPN5_9AGAR|nr:hypothetical protein D9613_003113 [Agrocybe pediades]
MTDGTKPAEAGAAHVSVACAVRPLWSGFSTTRRLVIFGDSYSSVGIPDSIPDIESNKPTAKRPLGVEYPGRTYNEPDLPNWVGHFLSKYCSEPRYNSVRGKKQVKSWIKSPLLVHNFAQGGATVAGIERQVVDIFLPTLGKKPKWAPWTAEGTLFITWVGINDCGMSRDPSASLPKLFDLQEKLYLAGARNFLIVDVPPVHRSPAVPLDREATVLSVCTDWNSHLRNECQKFSSTHDDATVLLFSAFQAFNTLLDAPETFGFDSTDIRRKGGGIWKDHIHCSSKVHDYIGSSIANFLQQVEPLGTSTGGSTAHAASRENPLLKVLAWFSKK